jgi:hypothetical protein
MKSAPGPRFRTTLRACASGRTGPYASPPAFENFLQKSATKMPENDDCIVFENFPKKSQKMAKNADCNAFENLPQKIGNKNGHKITTPPASLTAIYLCSQIFHNLKAILIKKKIFPSCFYG